jgi:hypothetical protein
MVADGKIGYCSDKLENALEWMAAELVDHRGPMETCRRAESRSVWLV